MLVHTSLFLYDIRYYYNGLNKFILLINSLSASVIQIEHQPEVGYPEKSNLFRQKIC